MGEKKRRLAAETISHTPLSNERLLLRGAANHLYSRVMVPKTLHGGCYYSSLALRHYLAGKHGLDVTAVLGFVRLAGFANFAWASHMWIEYEGRLTDIALHTPNPPVPKGPLVIDGLQTASGSKYIYSATVPKDGVPVSIEFPGPDQARRRAEHTRFTSLATADLDAVQAYLEGAPNGLYPFIQQSWTTLSHNHRASIF